MRILRLRRRPRRFAGVLAIPLLLAMTGALASCGSTPSQLTVNLAAVSGDSSRPGDELTYQLTVQNQGPGEATGVRAAVDLPAAFAYLTTPDIKKDFLGATRVQDLDPAKAARSPQWGSWRLAPPSTNADGTRRVAYIVIRFTVRAAGPPGSFNLAPRAVSDAVDSEVVGQPVAVKVSPAPDLRLDLSAVPTQVNRDQDVLYRVTIDNFGTGPAANLSLLITLPSGINFLRTESIQGNAARDQPVEPTPGSLLVFYSGFTVPAKSQAGPGSLIITMRGSTAFATGGAFTATAQLTDQDGTVLSVKDGARVTINAPAAPPTLAPPPPPPTAPPTARPTDTPKPPDQGNGGNGGNGGNPSGQ
jgi:uncharacterized repeat protein (TIGR01451 family)